MYGRGLIYLYLCSDAGRVGVRREMPFCPDHVVVDQPHCMMLVRDLAPHHRTKVEICASGNFWLVV